MSKPASGLCAIFSKRLKEIRLSKSMTQVDVAAGSGITQSSISWLETSPTANPTIGTVELLASALDCGVFELLTEADNQ